MIEKYLSEPHWKALVSKTPIKDTGLHKALVAYAKIDTAEDTTQALEALEEIGTQAAKLKKANPTLKTVTSYLDEVVKEVNKTKSGLAALAKPSEQKAEAEGTDLKARLISALKRVKAGEGEESLDFLVCVAKPCYGILLAKNASDKIGPIHKKELAELTKGTKFVQGKCLFEEEAHTFVVEVVPAGLAKNLKKALKQYTGLNCKVRVRDVKGNVVADGDNEIDPEDAPLGRAETPTAPPLPPGASMAQEMAKFTARFKVVQPDVVKAIAGKTALGEEIKQHAVQAGALANKKDFAGANRALDIVETLLKETTGTTGAPPAANGAFQKAWTDATAHLLEGLDVVRDQLAAFASALMASKEENLVWIAEEGLSQVFSSLRDAALTINRATSKLPARVVFKAKPAIAALKRRITAPRVLACDQNKLGVTVTIRDTMARCIQELEAALELAKS